MLSSSSIFSNDQLIVICISELQAKGWIDLEYFEIDLSFKRVHREINELEINCYNEQYKLTLTYARVLQISLIKGNVLLEIFDYAQVKGLMKLCIVLIKIYHDLLLPPPLLLMPPSIPESGPTSGLNYVIQATKQGHMTNKI
ncbi:hypothetical protein F8M41_007909 [Gigaspora margarita]|uniref:Uncharacterized protein n=1 Tax=Gigaspora margarita TaxID=4874 RepID=A0A8H3X5W5_GIGMA|nr:hypothetical protein F8M41_007909 [Gigaspora margarita]